MAQSMLSTTDNPYNPFTNFEEWYIYDVDKAREQQRADTCSYLASMVKTSDELSLQDEQDAIESAIDDIITNNVLGIYIRVYNDKELDKTN